MKEYKVKEKFISGSWLVEYTPEDGARLNRLSFNDLDLLSIEPKLFQTPAKNFGKYEMRPVYGYDDCFPSVDSSKYPLKEWIIPDHGEVCWLEWESFSEKNSLAFQVRSKALPVLFKREMNFRRTELKWNFKVKNIGDVPLPFQHVMHPLMKLDEITDIELPAFSSIYNETKHEKMDFQNPLEVKEYLLDQKPGSTNMLFLQRITEGKMKWKYKNGFILEVIFSEKFFPTIGIWWNNSGYPNEKGLQRNECAFEPIPGINSFLNDNYKNGTCLSVLPREELEWQVKWSIKNPQVY